MTFASTGFEQQFDIPVGVTSLRAVLTGGSGGDGVNRGGPGGRGVVLSTELDVVPDSTLYVEVAGNGWVAGAGFNGGGAPASFELIGATGAGGGGASDLRTVARDEPDSLASRLAVAAGGGGGGNGQYWHADGGHGGDGGNVEGASGTVGADAEGYRAGGPGSGGTQSSGGSGGSSDTPFGDGPGVPGGLGAGGQGGFPVGAAGEGGAGGGGYFGGGGGGAGYGVSAGGGGGGGSSWTAPGIPVLDLTMDDTRTPSIVLSWDNPNPADPDVTAPVISTHEDVIAEASDADGATVSYDLPTAYDEVDGDVPVTCSPATGSTFPLGATTVRCSATDIAGNTAASTFDITVVDSVAPVLDAHEDVRVEGTGRGGTVVTYAVPAATDAVDGDVSVTCAPASGSTFRVGTTTVICTATDRAGNQGSGTFHVTITADVPNRADLKVSVTGPVRAAAGSEVSYTLQVTNNGPATATDVSAALSTAGLMDTEASSGGQAGKIKVGGVIIKGTVWTLSSLASGATATFTITGTVKARPHHFVTAMGGAASQTPDRSAQNNVDAVTTRVTR